MKITTIFEIPGNIFWITLTKEKINNTKSREKQIEVSNIVLNKRGFAFVDLQDNVALDKAIEKLSGMKINGKEISVEHSGIFRFFLMFYFENSFFTKKYFFFQKVKKVENEVIYSSSPNISNPKSSNKKYSFVNELGRFGFFAFKIWPCRIM